MKKSTNIKEITNKERLPLYVLQLDVNNGVSVKNAIEKILTESGRIDILVNNAGYALLGALEDLSMDEIKPHYETNFFRIVRVTQAVLPVKKQKSSIIVNTSSLDGRIGFPDYINTNYVLEELNESITY